MGGYRQPAQPPAEVLVRIRAGKSVTMDSRGTVRHSGELVRLPVGQAERLEASGVVKRV